AFGPEHSGSVASAPEHSGSVVSAPAQSLPPKRQTLAIPSSQPKDFSWCVLRDIRGALQAATHARTTCVSSRSSQAEALQIAVAMHKLSTHRAVMFSEYFAGDSDPVTPGARVAVGMRF